MPGHARIPNEFFELYGPKIGCIGIALYALLLKFADAQTRECFPSLETICKTLDISRPTAVKFLGKLEEIGLISKAARRSWRGTHESNVYRVNEIDTAEESEPTGVPDRVNEIDTDRVNDVSPCKPPFIHRVNDVYTNKTQGEPDPIESTHSPPRERALPPGKSFGIFHNYFGRPPGGQEPAQISEMLEDFPDVTEAQWLQAVAEARTACAKRYGGNPKGFGWLRNALADLRNPVPRTGQANGHPNQNPNYRNGRPVPRNGNGREDTDADRRRREIANQQDREFKQRLGIPGPGADAAGAGPVPPLRRGDG